MDLVVRNARLLNHEGVIDIAVGNDRVLSVGSKAPGTVRTEIEVAGSLVRASLYNLHFHADKSLPGEIMRPNVSGTLGKKNQPQLDEEVALKEVDMLRMLTNADHAKALGAMSKEKMEGVRGSEGQISQFEKSDQRQRGVHERLLGVTGVL
jgi:cytosine/adenosine deaminase-related metal-dependent hydrolase